MRIKVSTYSGIALAMPVLLWQLWRFVSPGPLRQGEALRRPVHLRRGGALRPRRRHRLLDPAEGARSSSATSAATSCATAYSPAKYFQLIVYMMLAFGIGFEFPIVLVFLQLIGVVEPASRWPRSAASPSWASPCSWPSPPRRPIRSACWR